MLRGNPFGEWVNVFYDPSKTDTDTLLQLIRDRNCRNAQHITDTAGHALNPIIAPGDPVQFRVESANPVELTDETRLPDGWELAGQTAGGEGVQILTVTTPSTTREGDVDVDLRFADGKSVATQISVVGQVGRH